jgi:hypothetical protein
MKLQAFVFTCFCFMLGSLPSRAGINLNGRESPPELVAKAKELVTRKDYAGIDAMLAQLDTQYGNNYTLDYFRSLIGIWSAFTHIDLYPKIDYACILAHQRLVRKILLTPYSRVEDAVSIQDTRNHIANLLGSPFPFGNLEQDRDKFVALRNDEITMLEAYADSLRSRIISGYINKPEQLPTHFMLDNPADRAVAAEEKRKFGAQMIRNGHENDEQRELKVSLRRLKESVIDLVKSDYSWPPFEDETVNKLLDEFLPETMSRQSVLSELQSLRTNHLRELQEKQTGQPEKPH